MYPYNVCIIGKSGVGKSSLINYLYGESIQQKGTGKPCTELGFHPVKLLINDMPVTLFDSWGLEPDKINTWKEELVKFLKQHDIKKPANKWLHSIFYCISAINDRVEEEELKIIEYIISQNYLVTIIFTKSDTVSEEKLLQLKKVVSDHFQQELKMISVCSEEKLVRRGLIKPFGKEEVEKSVIEGFLNSLALRLPYRCVDLLIDYVNEWERKEEQYLKTHTGIFKRKEPFKAMQDHTKKLVEDINGGIVEVLVLQEIEKTFKMYNYYLKNLNFNTKLPVKIATKSISISFENYNKIDSLAIIFANLVMPVGVFFTKEQNYEDISKRMHQYTAQIKTEINKMFDNIQELINVFLEDMKNKAL